MTEQARVRIWAVDSTEVIGRGALIADDLALVSLEASGPPSSGLTEGAPVLARVWTDGESWALGTVHLGHPSDPDHGIAAVQLDRWYPGGAVDPLPDAAPPDMAAALAIVRAYLAAAEVRDAADPDTLPPVQVPAPWPHGPNRVFKPPPWMCILFPWLCQIFD